MGGGRRIDPLGKVVVVPLQGWAAPRARTAHGIDEDEHLGGLLLGDAAEQVACSCLVGLMETECRRVEVGRVLDDVRDALGYLVE